MPDDLDDLVTILADWANGHPDVTIYLFGSLVRGDHRPSSDVDAFVTWSDQPSDADTDWWTDQNTERFATINAQLPGKLHVQYRGDPLEPDILEAAVNPVLTRGNVVCVWLPPKPPQTGSF